MRLAGIGVSVPKMLHGLGETGDRVLYNEQIKARKKNIESAYCRTGRRIVRRYDWDQSLIIPFDIKETLPDAARNVERWIGSGSRINVRSETHHRTS
jgi:hypothetical protein